MIKILTDIIASIDESMFYLIESDQAWSKEYTRLNKERRILKRAVMKLAKLEAKK